MARFDQRLAAGAGVLTAFLVLGVPQAAVAVGDPGDRGDHRRDRVSSSDRGGGWGGGSDRGDDRGFGNANRPGNGNKPGNADGNRPGYGEGDVTARRDDDSARQDAEEIAPLEPGTARVGAQRLAPSDEPNASSGSDDADDEGAGSESVGSTGASGGSARSSEAAAESTPPGVIVGNGRTPVAQRPESAPSGGFSASDPAPEPAQSPLPPPPPGGPTLAWADLIGIPPVLPQQLSDGPAVETADPLWRIAGLLLIPAAGAALGYRQARAAHAAERLRT